MSSRYAIRPENMQIRILDLEPSFPSFWGTPSSTAAREAGFIVLLIPCSKDRACINRGNVFLFWRLGTAGQPARSFLVLHIFVHLIKIITDGLRPDGSWLRLVSFVARDL